MFFDDTLKCTETQCKHKRIHIRLANLTTQQVPSHIPPFCDLTGGITIGGRSTRFLLSICSIVTNGDILTYGRQSYKTKFEQIEIMLPSDTNGKLNEDNMKTALKQTSYLLIVYKYWDMC